MEDRLRLMIELDTFNRYYLKESKMEYIIGFFCIVSMLVLIGFLVYLYLKLESDKTKHKKLELLRKYGNETIVDRILRHMIWVGQTEAQLIDSQGTPVDVDVKVMKSKTQKTYKYRQLGRGKFGLRIILDNGVVVSYDDKT